MCDWFDPPIEPEPAGVAPEGIGRAEGQPGGNCPSSETDTDPSGVLTLKDRPGDDVDVEDELECDDAQPTTKMEAATATTRTKEPIRVIVQSPVTPRRRA
jgi:hypothetical protein